MCEPTFLVDEYVPSPEVLVGRLHLRSYTEPKSYTVPHCCIAYVPSQSTRSSHNSSSWWAWISTTILLGNEGENVGRKQNDISRADCPSKSRDKCGACACRLYIADLRSRVSSVVGVSRASRFSKPPGLSQVAATAHSVLVN